MKKILLVLSLLGLFGGWIEKSNEKEKTEISSVDFKEAEIYYNRGSNKYKLNDYEGAMLDFNKAIELNSDFTYAYVFRGLVKDSLKNFEDAILDYNKAIKLDPKYALTYYNRGVVKNELKQYNIKLRRVAGIDRFETAVEISKEFTKK